ncbi:putative leader peptide [Streptomyces sp. Pv4-95]
MRRRRPDSDRAVCAAQSLPLLTSRRHIDLLRVSSATSPRR